MTKTIGLLLTAFCIFTTLDAQIQKNSILLGDQLGWYNDNLEIPGSRNQTLGSGVFGFSVGKAYKENSVIGLNLTWYPINENNIFTGTDTESTKYNRFDIGAFYRSYKKLGQDFYFFTEVAASFVLSNQTFSFQSSSGKVKETQRGGTLLLTPGISYQVFKRLQLEISIPGILSLQYVIKKVDSQNPQVISSKEKLLIAYSTLNDNTSLLFVGVGLKLLL